MATQTMSRLAQFNMATHDLYITKADFPYWDALQWFILNGRKPMTVERELFAAAKAFLPKDYAIRYSGGIWTVKAPYGEYVLDFAVAMEQERCWNYREFQEGYEYARHIPSWEEHLKTPEIKWGRDANPYQERSRQRSWDCGYIWGLYDNKQKTGNQS